MDKQAERKVNTLDGEAAFVFAREHYQDYVRERLSQDVPKHTVAEEVMNHSINERGHELPAWAVHDLCSVEKELLVRARRSGNVAYLEDQPSHKSPKGLFSYGGKEVKPFSNITEQNWDDIRRTLLGIHGPSETLNILNHFRIHTPYSEHNGYLILSGPEFYKKLLNNGRRRALSEMIGSIVANTGRQPFIRVWSDEAIQADLEKEIKPEISDENDSEDESSERAYIFKMVIAVSAAVALVSLIF